MTDYILIILIIVSLLLALIFILNKIKSVSSQNQITAQTVFVRDGVNLNTMQFGMQKGDRFLSDQAEKKTLMVSDNTLPLCTVSLTNTMTGKEYISSFRTELLIGRMIPGEREKNKISIDGDSDISKMHCRLRYWNQQLLLDDLNTTNHTYLNGTRITRITAVNQNDVLKIGRTSLRIRFVKKG